MRGAAAEAGAEVGRGVYDIWPVGDAWQPSTVVAIVQTPDGYLWLGTYDGLVRYDGARFTVFNVANTPGLRNNRITSLHSDPDGVLWIGHETGELTRLFRGEFEPAALPAGWPGGAIEGIASARRSDRGPQRGAEFAAARRGDLWLLNDSGILFRLSDGRLLSVPGGATPARKATVCAAPDGRLWVNSNGRVGCVEETEMREQHFDELGATNYYDRVWPSRDGGVWVCVNGQARRWHNQRWEETRGGLPAGPGSVNVLRETYSGALFVGTVNDGVFLLFPDGGTAHFNRGNNLSHNWVRAVAEDHERNLWIGTGAGLDTLRPRKVTNIGPPDDWRGCGVLSFCIATNGATWVGTEGAGIYRFQENQWVRFSEEQGMPSLFVWSVLETRGGELLAGTWGGGVARWNGGRFETPPGLAGLTSPVVSMFESRAGELWIGTTAGLHRYRGGRLDYSVGKEELVLPSIRAMAETPDGVLWFGMFGGGLGGWQNGVVKQFRKANGLGGDFVQAILADGDGTLWIGTGDNGLTRLKDGKFAVISVDQGLPDTFISHVVDDGAGNLWLGSNRGVLRASRKELNRCAQGDTPRVQFLTYGRAEGMNTLTCPGGFQPGASKTPDGRLWFPTAKGIASIDPSNARPNPFPPPVVIEELVFANHRVNVQKTVADQTAGSARPPLTLLPGDQRFEIRYTALSFISPGKVRFRYQLEGLETEWVEAGTERVAQFSYLRPGNYIFRVTACNNDDIWNETGASLAITVSPRFYQTWWFQAGLLGSGAVLVGAAVWVIGRRRARHRIELVERQRALERERARIARDIHDDLGASLTRITLLSQSARTEMEVDIPQASRDVDRIFDTARDLTRAMDEIVWAVNPTHDTLDSLATYLGRFAQTFLSAAGIRCRLDVPLDLAGFVLTAEVRHNVFLAFKEALNNVAKHARATEVRIALQLEQKGFLLIVADNGVGFRAAGSSARTGAGVGQEMATGHPDPEDSFGGSASRLASGNGLPNMKRRLEEVGGCCEWVTAPGEGTRVVMRIGSRPS